MKSIYDSPFWYFTPGFIRKIKQKNWIGFRVTVFWSINFDFKDCVAWKDPPNRILRKTSSILVFTQVLISGIVNTRSMIFASQVYTKLQKYSYISVRLFNWKNQKTEVVFIEIQEFSFLPNMDDVAKLIKFESWRRIRSEEICWKVGPVTWSRKL
jgi:hypothetical protein